MNTDIDLLANVDGKIYVVEVKKTFANVGTKDFTQLKEIADVLRPDVVMLAVKAFNKDAGEKIVAINQFATNLNVSDVSFELLTLDKVRKSSICNRIPVPHHKDMKWDVNG